MIKICPVCFYPNNHPLGIIIKKSICSGCITHNEKYNIDWESKKNDLCNIIARYTKRKKKYDCVIPVVGDAEDYYTVSKVLSLGLSPLIVTVNDYFKNDIGWHNLHNLITYFDVDSLVYNPDIIAYKELIRTSLRKYDHMLLPFLQLHTSFPVHVALERNIPLIIWGQNQSVEQVGKFSHHDCVEMSKWSRREHDLFGKEIEELLGNGAQVNERNINYYKYPLINKLANKQIKGIYLSNYFKWNPLLQNESTTKFGFIPEFNNNSYDVYERAGSSVYYNIHDILKYKRNGYRKINDHVARDIRNGIITSIEGKKILSIYSQKTVDIDPFFKWLGVSKSGLEWYKKHKLGEISDLLTNESNCKDNNYIYKNHNKFNKKSRKSYITFGKGISI